MATLLITGHTHSYEHIPAYREIIVGNGGAPLTSGMNYGYVIIVRSADGVLTITSYDYATREIIDPFAITAIGVNPACDAIDEEDRRRSPRCGAPAPPRSTWTRPRRR